MASREAETRFEGDIEGTVTAHSRDDETLTASPATPPKPRSRFGLRLVAGLAGIALAGATVWAVQVAPLPGYQVPPASMVLSPVPGDQQRVCAGPLTLLGQSTSDPTATGYKGYAEIAAAGNVDDLTVAGIQPAVATATPPAAPTEAAAGVPVVFKAPGVVGDRATTLSVAQTVGVAQPGAAGFAATACRQPAADQWLVGGATTSGSSTMLSLVNPTAVNAVVRVELFGMDGALPNAGLDGVAVPAGTQVAMSLEGVAPGQRAFVAHVTTRGSAVDASLHEVGLQGLQADGIEIVGPSPQPSPRLDFVGVPFPTTSSEEDESVFAARGATLRLFTPGSAPVAATIALRDDATGEQLEPLELSLTPGVVSDVPLGAYPVGRYTVTVSADAPVIGALRSSLVTPPYDFAWYQPSPPLNGAMGVAVPPGPGPRLHLATTSAAPVVVTLVAPDGSSERITLEPGATESRDVVAGAYRLDGMIGTVASITYDAQGQMAGIPVLPGSPLAGDVTVYR